MALLSQNTIVESNWLAFCNYFRKNVNVHNSIFELENNYIRYKEQNPWKQREKREN